MVSPVYKFVKTETEKIFLLLLLLLFEEIADLGKELNLIRRLGLSFLGLSSSSAEWGSMLSDGRGLLQQCPWMVLYPSIAIFLVTILFNLLGDSVRDVLDPSEKNKAINDYEEEK